MKHSAVVCLGAHGYYVAGVYGEALKEPLPVAEMYIFCSVDVTEVKGHPGVLMHVWNYTEPHQHGVVNFGSPL